MAVRAPQARPPEPRARPGAAGAGRDRGEGTLCLSALATHSALGPPSAGTPPGGIGVYAERRRARSERRPPRAPGNGSLGVTWGDDSGSGVWFRSPDTARVIRRDGRRRRTA